MPRTVDVQRQLVRRLLRIAGTTYASEARIRLADKPMPLFQLLVLCMLASKPIDATIAMRAARELFTTGVRTPTTVLAADRSAIIRAFGRAHYVRYDESSATRLSDLAVQVRDEYAGDLRRMNRRSGGDIAAITRMLREFKGIGPTGADMFLREAQDVWTWVRPYFDVRATSAARALGLPADPVQLGALAPRSNARLAAALVRSSLDSDVQQRLTS